MKLLQAQNLSVGYEGKTVVSDLSFFVEEGDYFCVVGSNGSGKSTLIKTILGLKKPLSGSVAFCDASKRKRVGYLSQKGADSYKNFPASVEEVVRSGCLNYEKWTPFYTKRQKQRAEEAMKTLGVEDLKKRAFGELSGGQKQRVLLARALCATDACVVLDEPVTGLDPVVTKDMYDALKRLNERGITVVMVSHDVATALSYATRVLHIEENDSFFGTPEEYAQSDLGKNFTEKKTNA